jgi:chromosome segregation ATPase
MASPIRRALAALGLASAGQVQQVEAERDRVAAKITALEERVAKARADAEGWKRRHEELSRSVSERQDLVAKADAQTERARGEIEQLKARNEKLAAQVARLRAELTEAKGATATAREHLMATELKLDLVEAAIRVLDARTREAAVGRQAETR